MCDNVLFTDLIYLTGDDERELHAFAQSIGIPRHDVLRSNGVAYYSCWRKDTKSECLKQNVTIVKRKALRKFMRGLQLKRSLPVDWLSYKRFMLGWTVEIAEYNNLVNKIGFNKKFVHVEYKNRQCKTWFRNVDGLILEFILSPEHSEGHCNYEIPQKVREDIKSKIRYIQKYK